MGNEKANNLQLVGTHDATMQSYPLAEKVQESRRVPAEIAPSISDGFSNGPTDPNDEVMLILLMGRFEDRGEEHASRSEKTTEVQFDLLLQDLVAPPEEAVPGCPGGEGAFVTRQHGQEELVRQWAHRSIVVNPIERPLLGKVHFSWIGEFAHLAAPDGEQRPEGGCRI